MCIFALLRQMADTRGGVSRCRRVTTRPEAFGGDSQGQRATFSVNSVMSLLVACGTSRRLVVCRKQVREPQTNFQGRLR